MRKKWSDSHAVVNRAFWVMNDQTELPVISSLRSIFFQEKMTYEKQSKTVIYRSKMNPTLQRSFAVFSVPDWIAAITAHIPNKGEQLVPYYGHYSNVSRGNRKRERAEEEETVSWKPEVIEVAPPSISNGQKRHWFHFLQEGGK